MASEEFLYGCTVVSKGRHTDNKYDYDSLEELLIQNNLVGDLSGAVLSKRGQYIELSCNDSDVAKQICARGLTDKENSVTIPMRFMLAGKEFQVHMNNVPIHLPSDELTDWVEGHCLKVVDVERMRMPKLNATIGKVIITCEKAAGFDQLPQVFKLRHGRMVGVWHRGQDQSTRAVNTSGKSDPLRSEGDAWGTKGKERMDQLQKLEDFNIQKRQYQAREDMKHLQILGFAGGRETVQEWLGGDDFGDAQYYKYFDVVQFTLGRCMTLRGDKAGLECFQKYHVEENALTGAFGNLTFNLLDLRMPPDMKDANTTGKAGEIETDNIGKDAGNAGQMETEAVGNGGSDTGNAGSIDSEGIEISENDTGNAGMLDTNVISTSGGNRTGSPDSDVLVETVVEEAAPPAVDIDFDFEKKLRDQAVTFRKNQLEFAKMDSGDASKQVVDGFTDEYKEAFDVLKRNTVASSDGAVQLREKLAMPPEVTVVENTPIHDLRCAAVAAALPPSDKSTVESDVATATQVEVVEEGNVTRMEIANSEKSWGERSTHSLHEAPITLDRGESSLSIGVIRSRSELSGRTRKPDTEDLRKDTSQTKRKKKTSRIRTGEGRVKKAAKSLVTDAKVAVALTPGQIKVNTDIYNAKTHWLTAQSNPTAEKREKSFLELSRSHVARGDFVVPPVSDTLTFEEIQIMLNNGYATFQNNMRLEFDNPNNPAYHEYVQNMATTAQLIRETHRHIALQANTSG